MRVRALSGLRQFQEAPRQTPSPGGRICAQHERAQMFHFGSETESPHPRSPVLFVPSLINAPQVLDLAPDNSLLRFLALRGHDIYQVDWGSPDAAERDLDIGGHVTALLLPLIAQLSQPPILVGYCLGGTMAIGAANLTSVAGLVSLAAPWHFSAYSDAFRQQSRESWQGIERLCGHLGVMPIECLQNGFWSLDPARTIRKYADFGDLPPDDPRRAAFLRVEDWANEGAPLTLAAGRNLLCDFYGADLPGRGAWRIGRHIVDPMAPGCATFAVSSTTDRIVPHESAPNASARLTLDLGHVGMIVSRSAPDRLWKPLSEWLSAHGA